MFLLFCYQIVISSYSVKRGLPELWERASTSSRTAPVSLPLRWTTSSLTKWQADVRKLLAGNVERGFTFFFILLFLLNENISWRISLGDEQKSLTISWAWNDDWYSLWLALVVAPALSFWLLHKTQNACNIIIYAIEQMDLARAP